MSQSAKRHYLWRAIRQVLLERNYPSLPYPARKPYVRDWMEGHISQRKEAPLPDVCAELRRLYNIHSLTNSLQPNRDDAEAEKALKELMNEYCPKRGSRRVYDFFSRRRR